MENNMRFRNHFSIVLPNLKGILWLILMAFLSAVFQEDKTKTFVTVLTWIAIVVIVLVWQIIVWAKTWITIEENSIIIEKNTWFSRKKNTIGIANISNVNLEQGLFAMLLGTCKLKLDTNSLSTADATDVTIVLKKQQAEKLRLLLMTRISGEREQSVEQTVAVINTEKKALADTGEILLHGILSSRFIYAILIPLYIMFELISEMSTEDIDYVVKEVGDFAAATIGITLFILIACISWVVLAMGFSLVRTAMKYWGFQIERKEDKLVLHYGLAKKVNYSIPVDKIQAVIVKQSFLARIFKQYMVEVVNVGMNDDEKEAQSFLLPYSKRKVLEERMQQLLPEFSSCLGLEVERQPKSIWIIWLWPVIIYILIVVGIIVGVNELVPEVLGIVSIVAITLSFLLGIVKLIGYYTKGTKFDEEFLVATTGSFSRKSVYMKYVDIQYMILKQNFLAKRFGIQQGIVMILASATNQAQVIPYFSEHETEKIKGRLLK